MDKKTSIEDAKEIAIKLSTLTRGDLQRISRTFDLSSDTGHHMLSVACELYRLGYRRVQVVGAGKIRVGG